MTAAVLINGWQWRVNKKTGLFHAEIDGVKMTRNGDDWMRIFG